MKPKILLVGYDGLLTNTAQSHKLKGLVEKFEIVFAISPIIALVEIDKAKWEEKEPIRGLIFQRSSLVVNSSKCKLVLEFAENCSDKEVVAINMIFNDQDREARNKSVSREYCKVDDWQQAEVILDRILK
jgi:hypothetical protein